MCVMLCLMLYVMSCGDIVCNVACVGVNVCCFVYGLVVRIMVWMVV